MAMNRCFAPAVKSGVQKVTALIITLFKGLLPSLPILRRGRDRCIQRFAPSARQGYGAPFRGLHLGPPAPVELP